MADKLVFSKASLKQIEDIGTYTRQKWGVQQRDRYLGMIFEALDMLRHSALQGQSCDDIYEGMRKLPVGMHMIYYYHRNERIEIAGVLHGRMSPQLHLGGS